MATQIDQIVLTTPAFVEGQKAAKALHAMDPDSKPNWPVIDLSGPEFAAGFLYEWVEYIAPFIAKETS